MTAIRLPKHMENDGFDQEIVPLKKIEVAKMAV